MRLKPAVVAIALWMSVLCGTAMARAQDSVDAAMKRLAAVRIFAFGPVGLGGGPSGGELDFRIILSLPLDRALSLFQTLYENGNIQAKSYALTGIRRIDRKEFDRLSRAISDSKEDVTTEDGCLVDTKSMHDILKKIRKGYGESK